MKWLLCGGTTAVWVDGLNVGVIFFVQCGNCRKLP